MNGVTGRMGLNQHLRRSIYAIMQQGGVKLSDERSRSCRSRCWWAAMPPSSRPSARECGGIALDHRSRRGARRSRDTPSTSTRRPPTAAPTACKQGDCRRQDTSTARSRSPTASTSALELYRTGARRPGVKHGVVQDKLWLPGMLKLKTLLRTRILRPHLRVRGEFGYWVFEGDTVPIQRPSWNYRKEDGGGIIIDMLCHWRYVLDNLFGPVKAVSCLGATHIPDALGRSRQAVRLHGRRLGLRHLRSWKSGIVAHFNSSWCVRVRRDDLLTIQVDGTKGTAVAGLRDCWIQHYGDTPRPVWNPDIDSPLNYFDGWQKVPEQDTFDNAFKVQWELFLRHVVKGEPFRWGLLEGAKGVQLAEKGIESWQKRAWVPIPDLR